MIPATSNPPVRNRIVGWPMRNDDTTGCVSDVWYNDLPVYWKWRCEDAVITSDWNPDTKIRVQRLIAQKSGD